MNEIAGTLLKERSRPLVDPIQSPTNEWKSTRMAELSLVFLRIALGGSFLSAVADRFGLWGAYGYPNVAWGSYPRFVAYTAELLWLLPPATVPPLALGATVAETLFGLLLVLGWKTRLTSLLSGVLLTTFALSMTLALGVKAPLDYSVFSAAGGALLLATYRRFPFSLDELFRPKLVSGGLPMATCSAPAKLQNREPTPDAHSRLP
jgi:uncharacterized membrane protein YphA (DoxX/SURF4 family)